jgi:hypothetical protein
MFRRITAKQNASPPRKKLLEITMHLSPWSKKAALTASALAFLGASAYADQPNPDIASELQALKARIAELENKQNENWLTEERTSLIRQVVENVLADARTRGEFNTGGGGPDAGYKDGFYLQTVDKNFKIVASGFIQARYDFAYHHDADPKNSAHPFGSSTRTQDNSSGFDVRRARIKLTGNIVSPNVIYKFYGDFYGASTGAFTVLEAYAGYNFSDMFKLKAGAMEVPFTKDSLDSDTRMNLMARPEVFTAMLGTDTPRTIGMSLYGDIIKNQWSYEVQANNGMNSNTLRRPDTHGATANLDNRMGFYARTVFAGNGALKDFSDQPDLRSANRDFIWLLGAAIGYESQNSSTNSLPAPQGTAIGGVSNGDGPGFKNYTLNGDIFRATIDWSAKYQGWPFQAAALFQQINANPAQGTTPVPVAPDSSFFQHGYYGQIGYMVIPQKLEFAGRAAYLLTEDFPNIAEYYTVGANYYIYGHNAKIQADVTYAPESAFTDPSETQLQNTHNLSFRIQFQLMF